MIIFIGWIPSQTHLWPAIIDSKLGTCPGDQKETHGHGPIEIYGGLQRQEVNKNVPFAEGLDGLVDPTDVEGIFLCL